LEVAFHSLSDFQLKIIQQLIKEPDEESLVQAINLRRPEFSSTMSSFLTDLEKGPGFAFFHLPPNMFNPVQLKQAYWVIGHLLGKPVQQNVAGTVMYDVKDMGGEIDKGARYSITNLELNFHTDNSFGKTLIDYVGLLCIQDAKEGGNSKVVSGYSIIQTLQQEYPTEYAILSSLFYFDQRGGVAAGDPGALQFPILAYNSETKELVIRYLRTWVESGHSRVDKPLTPSQIAAMDLLDKLLTEPKYCYSFSLKPGDIAFVNNRWILHNRSQFVDWDEPEKKRHLVRLWLDRSDRS
jgi:alpha-ketoglutarate-dependent taurine dioxygenase